MSEDRRITQERMAQFQDVLHENERSQATIKKYTRDLEKLVIFLNGEALDKEKLIAYKNRLQEGGCYRTASINSFLAAINYFCQAMGWHDLRIRSIRTQKEVFREEKKYLTQREYNCLIETAIQKRKYRLAMIMQTIGSTGIRISELQYIDVECVYSGMTDIQCKGKIRRILLPKGLQKLLKNYITEQKLTRGSVFCTASGRPIDRSNIWREMKNLCKLAGIDEQKVFPHNLRHLFAICFYKKEKDIVKLADVLGHSNIETTRIYMKSTGEEHRRILDGMGMILDIT